MKIDGCNNNNIILALAGETIRRDANGIPSAIKVLEPGTLSITIKGQAISGSVTAADVKSIMDYHALKGEFIPVDCEHLIQKLADSVGVEEMDLIKTRPLLGENAAAGFVSLREEDGAVWAHVEKWTDRAKQLLSSSGDKMYAYFSPVLRGLNNGGLRITSLALTNLPAINKQDMLAASEVQEADLSDLTIGKIENQIALNDTQNGDSGMKEKLIKLITLLGMDSAALTAEGADLSELFEKTGVLITGLQDDQSKFILSLKDALELDDTATLDSVAGKVLSIAELQKGDTTALTEMQGRVNDLEAKEKERLIDGYRASGKLTEALVPWARTQDVAALMAWEAAAPVVVKPTRAIDHSEIPKEDSVALSENDKKVADMCGLNHESVATANNLKVKV